MFIKGIFFMVAFWYGLFLSTGFARTAEDPRIKIAIVDTGTDQTDYIKPFLCKGGHISLVDDNALVDTNESKHGTNIAWLVTQGLDSRKYCVIMIKFWDPKKEDNTNLANVIFGIKYATQMKAKYLNLSLFGTLPSATEERALRQALDAGVKVAVSAGNDGNNLDIECKSYPPCYHLDSTKFHVVGYNQVDGTRAKLSNYGSVVQFYEIGINQGVPPNSGSSQATAIHLNKWIKQEND